MNNWKEYKLSDIMEIIGGGTPKTSVEEYWNGSIPWLSVVDFGNNNKFVEKTEKKITTLGLKNSSTKLLKEGQIIISARGTVGEMAVIKGEMAFNQSCYGLNANQEICSNNFLYYLLKCKIDELKRNAHGAVFDTITRTSFDSIFAEIPNLPTQTAIAEILSSLDDKIELNNKINQELENLAQTLFKQWFLDFEFPDENGNPYKSSGGEMVDSVLGEIPKGWKVGTLNDLIDFSNGNAFKSNELLNENTGDCYHVFKMGHIKKGGGLNADGTKSYYEKSKAKKLDKYVLRVGDLLMCMTDMKGNVALLGHTALMNENDKYIVNQRVGLLRPNNDLGIDFPYLYILTNSNDFIEDLRSRANSGVQVNLSTSEIKSSKVLLPPKFINIEFDNCVKAFFENIFNNTKENTELSLLRDTLLPKLISGELEVAEAMSQKA
jgi:type I restriction enzyme S subunit